MIIHYKVDSPTHEKSGMRYKINLLFKFTDSHNVPQKLISFFGLLTTRLIYPRAKLDGELAWPVYQYWLLIASWISMTHCRVDMAMRKEGRAIFSA